MNEEHAREVIENLRDKTLKKITKLIDDYTYEVTQFIVYNRERIKNESNNIN